MHIMPKFMQDLRETYRKLYILAIKAGDGKTQEHRCDDKEWPGESRKALIIREEDINDSVLEANGETEHKEEWVTTTSLIISHRFFHLCNALLSFKLLLQDVIGVIIFFVLRIILKIYIFVFFCIVTWFSDCVLRFVSILPLIEEHHISKSLFLIFRTQKLLFSYEFSTYTI